MWHFLRRSFDFEVKLVIAMVLAVGVVVMGFVCGNINNSGRDDHLILSAINSTAYKYALVISMTISSYQIFECASHELFARCKMSIESQLVFAMLLTVLAPSALEFFYGIPSGDYEVMNSLTQAKLIIMIFMSLPRLDMIVPQYRRILMICFILSIFLSVSCMYLKLFYMVSSYEIRKSFGELNSFFWTILHIPMVTTFAASFVLCCQHCYNESDHRKITKEEKKSIFLLGLWTFLMIARLSITISSGTPLLENTPLYLLIINEMIFTATVVIYTFYHARLSSLLLLSYKVLSTTDHSYNHIPTNQI